jgi:hypothetical protein
MANIGFDIADFDRLVGDAPILDVFRALAGLYGALAEQVQAIAVSSGTSGISADRFIKLTPEERRAAARNAAVNKRLLQMFPLAEVEIARDACRAVVSLLTEQHAQNDRQIQLLIEQLQASLAAVREAAAENVAEAAEVAL